MEDPDRWQPILEASRQHGVPTLVLWDFARMGRVEIILSEDGRVLVDRRRIALLAHEWREAGNG